MAVPISGTIKGLSHRYTKNRPDAGYAEDWVEQAPMAGERSPIHRQVTAQKLLNASVNYDLNSVLANEPLQPFLANSFIDNNDLNL